jgi:hypothetical protein
MQNKKRTLKVAREKCKVTYKGKPTRITADFSIETLISCTLIMYFKHGKKNDCQTRFSYPAKVLL